MAENFFPSIDLSYAYFLQSNIKHNIIFVNTNQPIVEKTPLWFYLSFHGFFYNVDVPESLKETTVFYNFGMGGKVDPLYQINGFLTNLKKSFKPNYQYHLGDLLYLLKYCTLIYNCGKDNFLKINPSFHNLLVAAKEHIVEEGTLSPAGTYEDRNSDWKDVVRITTILSTSTASSDIHLMVGVPNQVFRDNSKLSVDKMVKSYNLKCSSVEKNYAFNWPMQTGTSTFDHTRGIVNSLTAHPIMGMPLSQQQNVVIEFQKRIQLVFPYEAF